VTTRQPLSDLIVPGRATSLFAADPRAVHHDLQQWVSANSGTRLLHIATDPTLTVAKLLDQVLDQTADALLALWPDWYQESVLPQEVLPHRSHQASGQATGRPTGRPTGQPLDAWDHSAQAAEVMRIAGHDRPLVSRPWLKAAIALCQSGRPPKVPRISPQQQARQMRLALAEEKLLLALTVPEAEAASERLLGLSRVSEWLAREADASVLVILSPTLRTREELDGINSVAVDWPAAPNVGGQTFSSSSYPVMPRESAQNIAPRPAHRDPNQLDPFSLGPQSDATQSGERLSGEPLSGGPRSGDNEVSTAQGGGPSEPDSQGRTGRSADAGDERKHLVSPILNRPHPASPGEQLLARHLARDHQLGRLFQFNQRLETIFSNRYLVDLVWADGRVVVEVDGYGWHSAPSAFHTDRQRDYELTVSGYLVLRLPHDLVMEDPERACDRIRDFVKFRRQNPFSPSS
jgi:very-short-patch-repair endonuclease